MEGSVRRKKIPYGISNFHDLVVQGYYFVDKTAFIETLEGFPEKYLFFLRPRRFGKSLFVGMLRQYYDRAVAADFDRLFGDLHIGRNPTPLRSSYHVLSFDFSGVGITSDEATLEGFRNRLDQGFQDFLHRYRLDVDYDVAASPENMMGSFLSGIARLIDGKLYVTIDEYDHFTSELLGYRSESFESLVARSGWYRKFFEVLKTGTTTIIDRIFITGVNPFTLDSLTSGFNIGSDLTLNPRLHDMMGFTEAEVARLFADLGCAGDELDRLMPMLRQYYDGYRFSLKAPESLYNSDMVLYFAKDYLDTRSMPDSLIDVNLASSYSRIRRYVELGDREGNLRFIRELLEGEDLRMALTTKFMLVEQFQTDDFKSLLFYMGLLTLVDRDMAMYRVRVPNYVVSELYFEFFKAILRDESDYDVDAVTIGTAVADLAKKGDIGPLVRLTETMLGRLANKDFRKFDEKYVKLVMLTWLFMSRIYLVKSEYEVEGGLIDIALLPRANVVAPRHAIIELKYLATQDDGDKALAAKVAQARQQLARYATSEELRSLPNLMRFVVVFRGAQCVHAEEASDTEVRHA